MLPVVREAWACWRPRAGRHGAPASGRLGGAGKLLREEFASPRIEWQADAAVPPGDRLVESAGMQIDGTLDKRWRRAIAALGLTSAWREDGHAD